MYRKSSKGNPYHDERGRFTSANGTAINKATGKEEQRPIETWSSFGERHSKKDVESQYNTKPKTKKELKKMWTTADSDKTNVAVTDGRRHYHNKSIHREAKAREVAHCTIPKGLTQKERTQYFTKAKDAFEAENRAAINNGGKVRVYRKGNSNEVHFQVVQSKRMMRETERRKSDVTRNTSTSMKQFSGFTVEVFKGNSSIRSCKKSAGPAEVAQGLDKYFDKHKNITSDKNTCAKIWRDKDDRVRFMSVLRFDTEAEAQEFAKTHGGVVVNHDDGSMA